VYPQAEQEIKFLLGGGGHSWRVGVVNLAVLVCVLRTTTKKRNTVVNFLGKVHPQRKSWLRLCLWMQPMLL